LVVEGNTYFADAPVRVLRSFNDDKGPILGLDAPSNGYRFVNQMQIAGHALDDVRVATVEVLVDGALVANILPSLFNKTVRDTYPTYPYASAAAFNQFVDLSSLADGEHLVKIVAYDTAGNTSESAFSVTKAPSGASPDVTYPVPNEAPVSVPLNGLPNPFANPGPFRITKSTVDGKGRVIVSVIGTGAKNCSVDLRVGRAPNKTGSVIGSYTFPASRGTLSAKGVLIHSKTGKAHLVAERRCLNSAYNRNSSRLISYKTRSGKIRSLKSLERSLKKGLKVSS
jgi:hypothetical protein